MKARPNGMLSRRCHEVAHNPVTILDEKYWARMFGWFGKPHETVVWCDYIIETFVWDPRRAFAARNRFPRKRTVRNRWRLVADSQGVVRDRTAKPIAALFRPGVSVSSGIDQERSSLDREFKRESVGVCMAAVIRAMRPTIKQEVVRFSVPPIPHHEITARWKGRWLFFGRDRGNSIQTSDGSWSK